ncbi:response regulator [Dysgonomonas sp. 216]|uniref:hybrid sensor histidine kinase/response regulator transcription factor n=1 Tax=Dysgonomonas sp. 216 TaxID=2302934 RepID=UPI0013D2A61D|nr:two-component regulator propeller domain-containing protein [Dysgonomonas sp. 216]NDW19113.1 response regulator [Dysgonomonas sp. 216]
MNIIKSIFVFLCFLIPFKLLPNKATGFHFYQISTKDGLSQNTVRTILEDSKGFIWAGTLDGLNRYDGYQIITYKPKIGSMNSLEDHRIKDVYEDKNNYLWIKTYRNGFDCYDPITDSFINYLPNDIDNETALYNDYYEASDGSIWLWGNVPGCLRVRRENNKFTTTFFLNSTQSGKIHARFIFEDSKGAIWTGDNTGLYKIDGDEVAAYYNNTKNRRSLSNATELNNKIYFSTEESSIIEYDLKNKIFNEIKYPLFNDSFIDITKLSNNEVLIITKSSGIISYNVNTQRFGTPEWSKDKDLAGNIEFIVDRKQGIWIYNHSGIVWYYNPETMKTRKLTLIPKDIAQIIDLERYNVFIDSKDLIWVTTYGNGLFCYDNQSETLVNYKYNSNQNSPASNYILSIAEDRFGNIWIGSEYAGIIKVTKPNYNISIIHPEETTSLGKNNNVRTIYESSLNDIWVGTKNGSLYVYNEEMTSARCIEKDLNPYCMIEDKLFRMWVGTKGKGLHLIDSRSHNTIKQFNASETNKESLSGNTIFNIMQDSKDRIWIGTFGNGINLVQESNDKITFKRFFNNEGNRSYIRYLYQDSKERIWAGTSDGIIRFNPEELLKNPQAYTTYKLDLKKENSLNSNDIKTIYEDNSGQIWIGTAGGGLNRYIEATENHSEYFIAYTTVDGLSGDIVSGILEDNEQNLWISSENGITKFDKKGNSFMTYHFSEKTYGNHFNENANLFCRNGDMMWGSLDGVIAFNPESFIPEENTPPVTLTDFFIYNQKAKAGEPDSPLKKSISYSDKVELNYKQNTFTIEFATLSLKNPEKNKYTYRLKDYDKQWSPTNHINTATYKNIPPGKYTFMVRGSNSDGIWNPKTTEVEIIITPPFWKSIWAYIIYSVLILLAIYIIMHLVNKFYKLNNAVEVEKQLTNHKLRFFTNISHEFRTPLTLIRGAVENLNEQTDVPERVKKHINVLSRNSSILTRLIDQLLEFRKLQNNVLRLDLEETDVIEFVRDIYTGFSDIAAQKQIEYTFVSETNSFRTYIDRRKLDKIIYNLLANAFKFTLKGGKIDVKISINQKNESFTISVKDNGIGIDKEKQDLLFSRFMQINFSSSGTGVGLSLVKEFVDVHKGKVWYETNTEDGKGSIFNVELSSSPNTYKGENFIQSPHPDIIEEKQDPLVMFPSEAVEIIRPDIDDSTLANYKMLIIDDNDDIRNFLVNEFSKYFMVDVAENGKEGLSKAINNNPNLIICDVMMPEMDGFEVTRRLKEEFQTCHIPIILLTAHSSLEHKVEGIQSGADAYIMKPFSIKYLVTRVFKLIEQREQLKKRFSSEFVIDGGLISSTDKDKEFYDLINNILDEHLADYTFSVDKFAELAKLKRTIFYKKVKGITGFSPNELIKIKRLTKAAELLLTGEFTVSEVSYKVGFEDPFYFSKCFKSQYKCSPSKFGQPKTE